MIAQSKICGLTTPEAVTASIESGSHFIGFVFYPPSPRHLSFQLAKLLAANIPPHVKTVAVTVDVTDSYIEEMLKIFRPDYLQLHGLETPERLVNIKKKHELGLIKAIAIESSEDLAKAKDYEAVADYLMLDAKTPKGALPGGMGIRFDWSLLKGFQSSLPWFLSGGLTPHNVRFAVESTGAAFVDISSGVESLPGVKDVSLIHAFNQALL